jgi:hypothetical protein
VKGNLDANAVHLLLGAGLQNRFPQLCKQWQEEAADISSNARATKASTEASIKTNFENDLPLLIRIFHGELVDAIIEKFPLVALHITLLYLTQSLQHFHPWFLPLP